MTFPKELTTVTKTSRYLALSLFIILPILGFFMGMAYQSRINQGLQKSYYSSPITQTENNPLEAKRDLKTFTSKIEGFTLKYPNDWTVEDNFGNSCTKVDCKDVFRITSPDGLSVVYDEHSPNDRLDCGVQAICNDDIVVGLEKINISNLGEVYLVKNKLNEKTRSISLHQPISKETTPVIGDNKHSRFNIDYSLPSKIGGRYKLFVTHCFDKNCSAKDLKFYEATIDQFYNFDSVKKAVEILKSLSY